VVYFIQAGNNGPVKIGSIGGFNLTAVGSRLNGLQTVSTEKLKIIACFNGGKEEEEYFHHKLRKFRVHHEWFNLNDKMIKGFRERSIKIDIDSEIFDKTISTDELVVYIQNEFNLDIYYKNIIRLIIIDREFPHQKAFGKRRYDYKESIKYLKNGGLKKLFGIKYDR